MPWNPADTGRHNKQAAKSPAKSKQWSTVANSVLAKTGDEGIAIRIANAAVKSDPKHGDGKGHWSGK